MRATTGTARWPGRMGFARMAGSSIVGHDAEAWATDFLNAAYYRRRPDERDVDDLRFAYSVLTTFWYRSNPAHRLGLTVLPAFHRAYGRERFSADMSARRTLSREELERGAAQLIGDWFPAAYRDDARRGWGIAFPTVSERDGYDPAVRWKLADVGALTPERAPYEQQVWHAYVPVEVPSAEGAIAALTSPETWPDYASEVGRFTPLRPGGLAGQTFEIEVAANTRTALPLFTRAYSTITALVTRHDPRGLEDYFDALEDGLARYGRRAPRAVPAGGEPLVGFDLTAHAGHFLGSGHNRVILYTLDGRAYLKGAGTWDPMPWYLEEAYRAAGDDAQRAFWGVGGHASLSMFHQLARQISRFVP